jgi:hypothetical protein
MCIRGGGRSIARSEVEVAVLELVSPVLGADDRGVPGVGALLPRNGS